MHDYQCVCTSIDLKSCTAAVIASETTIKVGFTYDYQHPQCLADNPQDYYGYAEVVVTSLFFERVSIKLLPCIQESLYEGLIRGVEIELERKIMEILR